MYRFKMKHTPGKKHVGPDTTSRYTTSISNLTVIASTPQQEDIDINHNIKAFLVASYRADESFRAVTWEHIVAAASIDPECIALAKAIKTGFPNTKAELPDSIQHYWTLKDELYFLEGVLMKGHRILIPQLLQAEVLECLHAAHQGVDGMSANAHQRLFWPGLDAHIRQARAQCRSCNRISPSQPKEPLAEPSLPELPSQHTVVDLCDIKGHTFLIFAD